MKVDLISGEETPHERNIPECQQQSHWAKEQRFLGVVVDAGDCGVTHVKFIIAATTGTANAIKRQYGTHWGGYPSVPLHLHNAIVVSRIAHGSPYLNLSPTQQLILERIHRDDIKTTLGVPRSTSTAEIYTNTSVFPIIDTAIYSLLEQMGRLHRAIPGRRTLDRVTARAKFQVARHLNDFRELLEDLRLLPPSPWPRHPSLQAAAIVCWPNIPELERKSSESASVLRTNAETYLEGQYYRYVKVFTDGSVSRTGCSATAALTIPSLGIHLSGRLLAFASSTTAEVAAITEALRAMSSLPPRNAVVLTDSACAIQRISLPPLTDTSTHDVTDLANQLTRRNELVVLQWIAGHGGIRGNTRADHLANDAHSKPDVLICVPDFRRAACELRRALC